MLIPIFSYLFQQFIENIIIKANDLKENSTVFYQQAQNILLAELGLNNWKPAHRLTFVKRYSETQQAERIDAEYFQPKYDDIINAIKAYKGDWDNLGNVVSMKKSNFIPSKKKTYQYIELANISGNGEITDCTIDEGQNLPTRARCKVNKNDVIVSSIEGSLSSIALIDEEYNDALCSTGFHIVKSEQCNSETLLVLLKSFVGQLQLKKGCSGTILTAISRDEFSKIIIPILAQSKQQEIQQKIAESFALRKKSKQLLEAAKRAVEIAIEQGETAAMQWLESQ